MGAVVFKMERVGGGGFMKRAEGRERCGVVGTGGPRVAVLGSGIRCFAGTTSTRFPVLQLLLCSASRAKMFALDFFCRFPFLFFFLYFSFLSSFLYFCRAFFFV
jgi:hypothetical protein